MTINNIWKLDKIVMPSSVEFSQISSSTCSAEIESMLEFPAGHHYPMFRANKMIRPAVTFTTSELGVLLGAIGIGGAAVGSTALYFKLATTTGNVARATASHAKITITESLAYWTSIRLPHNGRGEAEVTIQASYDDANDPFIYAASQALSGNLPTPSNATYFGAGPVAINGTTINGVQDITIDNNVQLIQAGCSSSVYDQFVGIQSVQTSVTVQTHEQVAWPTLGLGGTALDGATGITFYARKYSNGGGSRVANGTAEHVKFIGLNGTAIPMNSSAQDNSPYTDTVRAELIAVSDTAVPLTGTVNSAIT